MIMAKTRVWNMNICSKCQGNRLIDKWCMDCDEVVDIDAIKVKKA